MINIFKPNIDQQNFITSSIIEDSKLLGIPGGGKTTTIILKILELINCKTIKTSKEYLILTFSRKACDDFIKKFKNIIQNENNNETKKSKKKQTPSVFNSQNCKTFHSLSGSIIQTLLKRSCSSLQTSIISSINILKQKIEENKIEEIKIIKFFTNLKLLVIDEAQDMSDIQYELVNLIKKITNCTIILVGDPNQNIYQFQNGSDKYLLEYLGKTFYLKENNRSTPEITNFINYFKPWVDLTPNMISIRKSINKKPIIFSGSHDEILKNILNEIKNDIKNGISLSDIAVVGPVKKSDGKKDGIYLKFGLQAIVNILKKNKIKFIKHYNDTTEQEIIDYPQKNGFKNKNKNKNNNNYNDKENENENGINIYTIHGSKGLEFKKVYVLNFHTMTFGANPTLIEYNEFKYLWYVALSRAKDEMIIYVDSDKSIWHEITKCPKDLYICKGKPIIIKDPKFQNPRESPELINEILYNKKYFTESNLLEIYEKINFSSYLEPIYNVTEQDKKNIDQNYEFQKYSVLFKEYLKIILEYFYEIFNLKKHRYINYIETFCNNLILIDDKFSNVLKNFIDKLGLIALDTIKLSHMICSKNLFDKFEIKLYRHILKKLKNKIQNNKICDIIFSLAIESNDIFLDSDVILQICKNIRQNSNSMWNLFLICLFEYQYLHESKYLWFNKDNFKNHLKILENYIKKIKYLAMKMNNNFDFCKSFKYFNINLFGKIDCIKNDTIIDIRFTNNIDITHKIQAFLYYNGIFPNWKTEKKIEIWNLKTGQIHIITFNPNINSYQMMLYLAKITNKILRNMIFVYDLETTGLDINSCHIIERYIYELNTHSQVSSGVIKPNAIVPKIIHNLTGITKKEIQKGENLNIFKKEMNILKQFCSKPIFIAHNGNVFDSKIMMRLNLIDNNCIILDSRVIFRQLSKENIGNKNLSEIYETIIGVPYNGLAHRAKADVCMMLEIFEKLNLTSEKIIKFANL
jgi:hypothetical protein